MCYNRKVEKHGIKSFPRVETACYLVKWLSRNLNMEALEGTGLIGDISCEKCPMDDCNKSVAVERMFKYKLAEEGYAGEN